MRPGKYFYPGKVGDAVLTFTFAADTAQQREKLERLYDRYGGLMHHVAMSILRNRSDADDAVQEAFYSIFKNIGKISSISDNKTRSLIVIITEHKALDIYRARERNATLNYDEAFMGAKTREYEMSSLAMAMSRLPKDVQNILLLKYDNGYSSREISAFLGISDNSVRQMLYKARRMLEKELEKEAAL